MAGDGGGLAGATAGRLRRALPRPPSSLASCSATAFSTGAVMLATTVGARSGRRSRRLRAFETRAATPLAAALAAAASIAGWLVVVADDRVPAELGCGDREDAGAGAEVGERAAGLPRLLQLQQELEAEPGGRVGAGAEGLAGVDDDVDRALARLLPGGAQPEAVADQERFVEVLPAVGPVVGNLGRDRPRPGRRRPPPRSRPARAARPRRRRSRTRRSSGPRSSSTPFGASTVSSARTARPARATQRTARRINRRRGARGRRSCRRRRARERRLCGLERLAELLGQLALLLGEVARGRSRG